MFGASHTVRRRRHLSIELGPFRLSVGMERQGMEAGLHFLRQDTVHLLMTPHLTLALESIADEQHLHIANRLFSQIRLHYGWERPARNQVGREGLKQSDSTNKARVCPMKVALLEDDLTLAESLCGLLTKNGHQCLWSETGREFMYQVTHE